MKSLEKGRMEIINKSDKYIKLVKVRVNFFEADVELYDLRYVLSEHFDEDEYVYVHNHSILFLYISNNSLEVAYRIVNSYLEKVKRTSRLLSTKSWRVEVVGFLAEETVLGVDCFHKENFCEFKDDRLIIDYT